MRGDTGLFGPGSMSWRVHRDPSMWVAAFYALAVQSLHPPTMRATHQHSTLFVRAQALGRLLRTADFVAVRTFGSLAEVERAGRRVRGIHARLRGTDPDTGATYRVDAPENLLWVHCGEVLAYVDIARRAGIVDDDEADVYLDEQRRAAAVVGLDPATVPGSVAELDAYFARMRPQVRLTREACDGILLWLNVPAPPRLWALKLGYPVLAGLAFALLPTWARRAYHLPGRGPVTDAAATALLRGVRRVMLAQPERWRGTAEQMRRIAAAGELEARLGTGGRPVQGPG